MHATTGQRDPATAFSIPLRHDDAQERRLANRAIGVSAIGLAITGLLELIVGLISGSVGLLGDALHNLSDVSTSALVFVGFRMSRKSATERYPYGYERAEDLAGVGIAIVIWSSAVFAGFTSVHKLLTHGATSNPWWGAGAAAVGILGNQVVAPYKLRIGRRINSATLIADAQHSWLDALSSAGALLGLVGVIAGARWADPVAGLVVTLFICHVGWEVTSDVAHRLLDGVEPEVIETAEAAASHVAGVQHAHARARWTGRTLRIEIEGWIDADATLAEADRIGQYVVTAVADACPDARNINWTARAV